MKDLKQQNKKLQIFYTFVVSFDALVTTVKEMLATGEAKDYMRAEAICDVIGEFTYNAVNVQMILDRINSEPFDDRLKPLYADLVDKLKKQEDSILMQITARHQLLLNTLTERNSAPVVTKPAEVDEDGLVLNPSVELIKAKKGIPIKGYDLKVLNNIAIDKVSHGQLISDYTRKYKKPKIKEVITRLFHESPYYFEQAFSNTEVEIQSAILEIISDKVDGNDKNKKMLDAFKTLKDLHVLATIDTSANKMRSAVSEHQAFEMFLTILEKNINEHIIDKLIYDNVIMKTMFNVVAKGHDGNYGFRRIFTAAHYPYDGMVLEKFKQIRQLDETTLHEIISELGKDENFKLSYEKYLRTEHTKVLLNAVEKSRKDCKASVLTDQMIFGICYVLEEFQNEGVYNQDILTPELMTEFLEDVYGHIIRNKAYHKYTMLNESLSKFFSYRVNSNLSIDDAQKMDYGCESTFAITEVDLWYDCHKMIYDYKINHVEKMYFQYDAHKAYAFEVGQDLKSLDQTVVIESSKDLPKGHYSMECSDTEQKGFEFYVYNLYARLVKIFIADKLKTTLSTVKSSTFRKIETPGLSSGDNKNARKAILEYITLQYLWKKDAMLFIHVYRSRINALLKAITSIEGSGSSMKKFIDIPNNEWVLQIFSHKKEVSIMTKELQRMVDPNDDDAMFDFGTTFFDLADVGKE